MTAPEPRAPWSPDQPINRHGVDITNLRVGERVRLRSQGREWDGVIKSLMSRHGGWCEVADGTTSFLHSSQIIRRYDEEATRG